MSEERRISAYLMGIDRAISFADCPASYVGIEGPVSIPAHPSPSGTLLRWSNWIAAMGELLTWLGSMAGLLSGAFLLYDRFAKGRPIASLTVKDDQGPRDLVCIRVTNIGDYDIAVIDASVSPKIYFLTEDMEARTLIEGALGHRPSFMLKPRQEKELRIAPHFKDAVPLEAQDKNVTFRISWRRCNMTWLPQVPVCVRTSTPTIRKYVQAKSAGKSWEEYSG
jgi:hypothetical protein